MGNDPGSEVADRAGARQRLARGSVPQDHGDAGSGAERFVIRAFWFMTVRSFKNRLLVKVRRLRQPRYLVGFIAGLAYIWFTGLKRIMMMHSLRHGMIGIQIPTGDFVIDCVAFFALLPMFLAWALPDQEGGLVFSEAEIQFLFAGPVSRRQLLIYKVLRQQPSILISSLLMSFFGFGTSRFIGIWLTFVTFSIYFTAVGLARARLKLAGIGFLLRLVIVLAALAGLGALLIHAFGPMPHLTRYDSQVFHILDQPLRTPAFRILLFLPRFFAAAVLPESVAQLGLSCLVLAIIAFAILQIAGQLNVSFEDASIHAAKKKESYVERARSFRSGQRVIFPRFPSPFRLPPKPSPELAILWKNLIATMRISMVFMVVILAVFALLMGESIFMPSAIRGGAAAIALFICCFFPLIASNILSQDLRLDLQRIEILKSYPISGERLVAAEIAAPLTVMSAVELLLLTGSLIILHLPNETVPLQGVATPQFAVVVLLFAIPICAMQLLIRNAAAVLFPAWTLRSQDDPRGFTVIGQRLVVLAGNLLILTVSLVPPAIVVLIGWLISRSFNASFALPFATVPAVALLAGEVWLGIKVLGAQFEKIDVTNEMGSAIL
ncbi:MAG TPA: putative ABC exporter domain-containing protein [Thermoanaerobaculia bacterium]|nr:putative ABC exporter domain-containing protein [Thermoanaerobaculia bacterium]